MAAAPAATSLVVLTGAAQAGAAKPTYYVSVGDSYSVGYQPGVGATTGYAGYVTKKTHLTLANFGCGGATTASIIDAVGCPDVLLGAYVYPAQPATAARMTLASESVVAFKSLINPALAKTYAAAGGAFVDVTAATGAYTPLTTTVTVAPYGTIPRAVARVCTLTWFCAVGNIHATSTGYALIGKLVAARYATLRRG